MAFEGYKNLLAQRGQTANLGMQIAQKQLEEQKYADLIARKDAQDKAAAADILRQQQMGGALLNSLEAYDQPQDVMGNLAFEARRDNIQPTIDDLINAQKTVKGFYPQEKTATPPTDTDMDDYVKDAKKAWKDKTGSEMPAGEVNKARLEYKRAQAPEVASTTAAKTGTDLSVKEIKSVYDSAKNAKEQLVKVDELINQVNTSEAITGMGANFFKQIERIKAKLGSDSAKGVVIDTQYLDALMGSEVFAMIKALGVGARGLDTPAEREFMRQVITGELPMEKGTILKMAQFRRDAAMRDIKEYNEFEDIGAFNNLRLPRLEFGAATPAQGKAGWTIKKKGQ